MELRYAFLADFVSPGHNGKMVVVGIFDTVYDQLGVRPIPFPPSYLFARFECHVAEGSDHQMEIRFLTEDGNDAADRGGGPITFQAQGPGRPLLAQVGIPLFGFSVGDLGEYAWHFLIDGAEVGRLDVFVTPPVGRQ